jgi:hypothetical protein
MKPSDLLEISNYTHEIRMSSPIVSCSHRKREEKKGSSRRKSEKPFRQ